MSSLFIDFCDLYDSELYPYADSTLLKIFPRKNPKRGYIFEYLDKVNINKGSRDSKLCHSYWHTWAFYIENSYYHRLDPMFSTNSGFDRVLIKTTELQKFVDVANAKVAAKSQNNSDKEMEFRSRRKPQRNKVEIENVSIVLENNEEEQEVSVEPPSVVPKENINICFVGGVSTGKSTILNAIFCEQLTQCKIKRTTMVPTVYVENLEPLDLPEHIFSTISLKNKEIIDLTEQGVKLTKDQYSELVFQVGKLDINILPDSFVNVYDIPGLNDARTKDQYYSYLEQNFFKFNLIIFIVDIHSGLNTSDEIDIVNFITNHTRDQKETKGRNIFTLVVVNKADDMVQQEGTKELHLTGELKEMYDQVIQTVEGEFKRKGIEEQLIGIVPLCALDSYLYRMVRKHGSKFDLSEEQILKIGVNETGKKFSTLSKERQRTKVQEILQNKEFIDEMIDLSGFGFLEQKLHDFLCTGGQGKTIRINNLLDQLRHLPSLEEASGKNKWFDMSRFKPLVEEMHRVFYQVRLVDDALFQELYAKNIVAEVDRLLRKKVSTFYGTINELLQHYEDFSKTILKPYCEDLLVENEFVDLLSTHDYYPGYLIEKFVRMIVYEFEKQNNIEEVLKCFQFLVDVNAFTKANVMKIISALLQNERNEYAVPFNETSDLNALVAMLKKIKNNNVDITKFVRFLIINRLASVNFDPNEYLKMIMYYQRSNEIAIQNYMRIKFLGSNYPISLFIDGVDDYISSPLDQFYLSLNILF